MCSKHDFALNLLTTKWCSCYFIAILLVHRREHSHLSTLKWPWLMSAKKFVKIRTPIGRLYNCRGLYHLKILFTLLRWKSLSPCSIGTKLGYGTGSAPPCRCKRHPAMCCDLLDWWNVRKRESLLSSSTTRKAISQIGWVGQPGSRNGDKVKRSRSWATTGTQHGQQVDVCCCALLGPESRYNLAYLDW